MEMCSMIVKRVVNLQYNAMFNLCNLIVGYGYCFLLFLFFVEVIRSCFLLDFTWVNCWAIQNR